MNDNKQNNVFYRLWLKVSRPTHRLWLVLGLTALLITVIFYFEQAIRWNSIWCWDQLWHHEPLIGIAFCVGIALLFVSWFESRRDRHNKRKY